MKHHMSFTPAGVRNLIKVRQKYLFRSLYTKRNTTQQGGVSFWSEHRHFAPCSARQSRSGIRFAFEPKADGSSLTGGSAKNSRFCEAKTSTLVPKTDSRDACPYKRYFTFFEKYVIIVSTNNFQFVFLHFRVFSV